MGMSLRFIEVKEVLEGKYSTVAQRNRIRQEPFVRNVQKQWNPIPVLQKKPYKRFGTKPQPIQY